MKRMLARVVVISVLLALGIFSAIAGAAGPPITVTHKLAGYDKGEEISTFDFTVQVTNGGDTPVNNVSLRVARSRYFLPPQPVIDVGTIAPRQTRELTLQVKAPKVIGKARVLRQRLMLAGKCTDSAGNIVEFPVTSNPGGAL